MTNRFIRLQELVFDKYSLDCPVEIEKGALLLDHKTGSVLLQLRINIIIPHYSDVSAISLYIEGLDEAFEKIDGIDPYTYTIHEVNLLNVSSFGDKKPIKINSKIRRVKIHIEKVITVSGTPWKFSGKEIKCLDQSKISTLNWDLAKQLTDECDHLINKNPKRIEFFPLQADDYWLCSCGRPNKNDAQKCCRCGLSKNWQFTTINEEYLQKKVDEINENNRVEEEKKLAKKKKQRKIIYLFCFSIIAIGLVSFLIIKFLLPFLNYNYAMQLLNNKQYDASIVAFENLGNYSNSKDMINEAHYRVAIDIIPTKQYDEAIVILQGIDLYKNSKDLIKEITYMKGVDLFSKRQYKEAIGVFNTISDYKNVKDLILESQYYIGLEALSKNQFEQAIDFFNSCKSFKDSTTLLNRTYFSWGIEQVNQKNWNKAIGILKKVDENLFPDAKKYLDFANENSLRERNEETYQSALRKADEGNYRYAYNLLKDLNYRDSAELAKVYEQNAIIWRIKGSLEDDSISKFDSVKLNYTVYGGKSGERISINTKCVFPGGITHYGTVENDVGEHDQYSYKCWLETPYFGITGKGSITIYNNSTGQELQTYYFSVF
jgi:TolA-binding protein